MKQNRCVLKMVMMTIIFVSSVACLEEQPNESPTTLFESVFSKLTSSYDNISNALAELKSENIQISIKDYLTKYKEKVISGFLSITDSLKDVDPNSKYRTLEEKIINAGFRIETHKVVTEDRYVLTAFRIPGKLNDFSKKKKKPVTLVHGLLDNSHTWLTLNNTNNLAIQLAEKDYDIWLLNVRGNMFSFEHLDRDTHNPSELFGKFWDFSWDEIAKYDLKAFIEYVKLITEFEKVIYVGHSQGTFTYFLGYTLYPEFLESSIEKFVGLGPMVSLISSQSPWIKVFNYTNLLDILYYLNFGNIMVLNNEIQNMIHLVCSKIQSICASFVQSIVSIKTNNRLQPNKLSDLFYFEPGGTSVKNLLHWIQLYRSQKQTWFDYGSAEANKKHYGQNTPPEYNFDQFVNYNIPSLLTYSDNDSFSYPKDVQDLVDRIPLEKRDKIMKILNLKDYNHLDYLWSDDAVTDIYPHIFSFIEDGQTSQSGNRNLK